RDPDRASPGTVERQDGQAVEPLVMAARDAHADEVGEQDREPAVAPVELEAVVEPLQPPGPELAVRAPHDCIGALRPGHQWLIVPATWPTFRRPTSPSATLANE